MPTDELPVTNANHNGEISNRNVSKCKTRKMLIRHSTVGATLTYQEIQVRHSTSSISANPKLQQVVHGADFYGKATNI